MSLRPFRSDLLRSRALSILAEIHEWQAEFEAENLEPAYEDVLHDQIDFAIQCLTPVLAELARRGELSATRVNGSQLELELIPDQPFGDPGDSDRKSFYRMGEWLAAPDDPF